MKINRNVATLLVAFCTLAHTQAAPVTDFSDLNFWGSGSNQSGLIINWDDGSTSESMAWGFNWSGPATMADMIQSLAAEDSRLFARLDSTTAFGLSLFGLGYEKGASSFGITGATADGGASADPVTFVNGVDDLNTNNADTEEPDSSVGSVASNSGDLYLEGWLDTGFWGSSNGGVSTSLPTSVDWTANGGATATTLQNDGWYAFIYKPGFAGDNVPNGPITQAIPEPSTILMLVAGLGVISWLRRVTFKS